MPKLKLRKSVAKRFKVTKRGKVKSPKPFKGHLLSSKSRKRKRQLRTKTTLQPRQAKTIRGMMLR